MLKKLRAAFPLLTDEQKKLVVWKFFKNLSDTEIGKRLGNITRQAVQNRLKKIYEKLKKSL
jgi:RNA polymerase sigma factor (sigma-70 family)